MRVKPQKSLMLCAVAAILAGSGDWAMAGLFTGTFEGTFTNPQLSGIRLDVNGNPVFVDSSATAVYSGIGTNTLQWGEGPFSPINHSTVTFTGFSVTDAPSETEIPLGVFSFENGTSSLGTPIFGADFTIWLPEDGTVIPLVTKMGILTTANRGEPHFDADFLTFDNFPDTFHVYEYASATAILYGRIVGDPEIDLTHLVFQEGSGFIGAVPEPATWTLFAIGASLVAGRAAYSRKRQRNARTPASADPA